MPCRPTLPTHTHTVHVVYVKAYPVAWQMERDGGATVHLPWPCCFPSPCRLCKSGAAVAALGNGGGGRLCPRTGNHPSPCCEHLPSCCSEFPHTVVASWLKKQLEHMHLQWQWAPPSNGAHGTCHWMPCPSYATACSSYFFSSLWGALTRLFVLKHQAWLPTLWPKMGWWKLWRADGEDLWKTIYKTVWIKEDSTNNWFSMWLSALSHSSVVSDPD